MRVMAEIEHVYGWIIKYPGRKGKGKEDFWK